METLRLLTPDALRLLPDSLEQGRFAPPFEAYGWTAKTEAVAGIDGLYHVSVIVAGPEGELRLDTRLHHPDPLSTTSSLGP
jgi:hypothetical protein